MLCGHTHTPRLVQWRGGPLIVNPGSVGLPAYEDDPPPFPHVMETGSPQARYALADRARGAWRIQFHAVVYDHEPAAARAEAAGRSDWAMALRSGRVRSY